MGDGGGLPWVGIGGAGRVPSALVVGGAWALRVVIMVGCGGMGMGDGVRPPTMGHPTPMPHPRAVPVAQGWPKGPPRTLHARRGGTLSRAVFTHTLSLNLAVSCSSASFVNSFCCLYLSNFDNFLGTIKHAL